jgi:hypothetical protein
VANGTSLMVDEYLPVDRGIGEMTPYAARFSFFGPLG